MPDIDLTEQEVIQVPGYRFRDVVVLVALWKIIAKVSVEF
jgi:hypothetical protein